MTLIKNDLKNKKYILGVLIFFIIIGLIDRENLWAKRIKRFDIIPDFKFIKKYNNRAHMKGNKWIPDLLTWVKPSLKINYDSLNTVGMSIDSTWYFTKERPEFNSVTHDLSLSKSYIPNRRLSFIFNLGFSETAEIAKGEATVLPEIAETSIKEVKDLSLGSEVSYRFNRKISGSLGVSTNKTKFEVIAGFTPKGDSIRDSISNTLSYRVSRRTDVNISSGYIKRYYENLDSEYKEISIYYGYRFTPNAKLNINYGRFRMDYEEEEYKIDNYYENDINVELAFNVANLGKGSFQYYKTYNATDFISELIKEDQISMSVGRRLFPKTYIFFWTGRRKNDYKGMFVRDLVKWNRYWAYSIGINYRWHKWLSPTVLPIMTGADFNVRYDFIDNHYYSNKTPEPEGRLQNHMLNLQITTYH